MNKTEKGPLGLVFPRVLDAFCISSGFDMLLSGIYGLVI